MNELVVEIRYADFPYIVEENIVSFGCGDRLQREVHCKLDHGMDRWFSETGTKPPIFVSKHVIQETQTLHPYFQENMLKFWFADHRDAISFKLAWG